MLKSEDETGNMKSTPEIVNEMRRISYTLEQDRCVVDFDRELQSLQAHSEIILRPRLASIVNHIYIPKFKAKVFASYLYDGENSEVYNDYRKSVVKSKIFSDVNRSKDDLILGIESSFDDSAAGLVNSYGEVISNVKK
jgi:hypothetical protein